MEAADRSGDRASTLTIRGADPLVPYWFAFSACAAAALACIWSVRYLPMVDLPQHAAQISLWKLLGDPSFPYAGRFERNWFTPYLLAAFLIRLFATVVPVWVAAKCVVSLAVVGLPLAMKRLLDATGGDRWWALLGFPLAFGHGFYWGLLPHLVSVPLGIALVAEGFLFVAKPSTGGTLRMGLLALLLLVSHVLTLVFASLVVTILVLALAPDRRAALAGSIPQVAAIVAAVAWFALARAGGSGPLASTYWSYGVLRRLTELPGAWFGDLAAAKGFFSSEPQAEIFRSTVLASLVILCLPLVAGLRPLPLAARWVPFAGAAAIYLFAPLHPFGSHFVNTRYAVFLVPFGLAAVRWPESEKLRRAARVAIVSFVLGWTILLVARFRDFDREARDFQVVLRAMEPNRTVLSLPFVAGSQVLPGLPYLHFAVWYQVEKGGIVDVSFAQIPHHFIRYRSSVVPAVRSGFEFEPASFDWRLHGGYDYFLVRAKEDLGGQLFGKAAETLFLKETAGTWWLYQRGEPPAQSP